MSDDKQKIGDMIPIRDGRGNFLTIGSEVIWTGCKNLNHLKGVVTGFQPGGISVIETGNKKDIETPAQVRVSFNMIIALVPGQLPVLPDYFLIVNPDAEAVIEKVLAEGRPS